MAGCRLDGNKRLDHLDEGAAQPATATEGVRQGSGAAADRGAGASRRPLHLYLRAAGIGHPIRSTLDHAAVLQLAKVNDDQGRLGGLLKLWLVEKPGQGAPESEVRRLLDRLGELQTRLAEIAGRM
jgi:hypothetical protein